VRRKYEWTHLYAAVAPTTGESYCMYLPGMDDGCLEIFLDGLSRTYPEHHLLIVLDGAPSHRSEQIVYPENISFLKLPRYSPELDPSEAREMVPGVQARVIQQDLRDGRSSARGAHPDACLCLTGKTPLSSNGSPDIAGGWRRWRKRYAINRPGR